MQVAHDRQERMTVSPSISNMRRSTPWVDGCDGPMLSRVLVVGGGGVGADRCGLGFAEAQDPASSPRRRTCSAVDHLRVFVGDRHRSLLAALNWTGWRRRRSPCGEDARPSPRHEDPAHVGVVGEGDAEHVERLTLEVLAGPQVEEARNGRLVGAHLGADTDPLAPTWLISG